VNEERTGKCLRQVEHIEELKINMSETEETFQSVYVNDYYYFRETRD